MNSRLRWHFGGECLGVHGWQREGKVVCGIGRMRREGEELLYQVVAVVAGSFGHC